MTLGNELRTGGLEYRRQPPPPPVPSDETLMERVGTGDRAAFGILVDRYWASLVVFAERFVHRRETAKDMVQEAFANVWEGRESWTPSGSAASYLYRITRNLALNEVRRLRLRRRWAVRIGPDRSETPPPETPAEVLEGRELRRAMEEAVRALPPRRREVFVLARFHGLSYQEIAHSLGISRQTVANQMSAALSELRRALSERADPA